MKDLIKSIRRNIVGWYVRSKATPFSSRAECILIIAPHPDDETFGCGGLIALKRSQGLEVHVLILSRGEASHKGCCAISEDKLGELRTSQAEQACAILGLAKGNLHWFDLPDGEIGLDSGLAFKAEGEVTTLMGVINPSEIYVTAPFDCWADHERAFNLVKNAIIVHGKKVDLYAYPIWMWHNLRLRDLGKLRGWQMLRLDTGCQQEKKHAAIRHYLDGFKPECGKPICGSLPTEFTSYFVRRNEIFFKEKSIDEKHT